MSVPMLFRAAVALWGVSLIFFVAGFASPNWMRVDIRGFNYGLWAVCFDGHDCATYTLGGHVYVARVCGFYQLFGSLAGIVLVLLFMFKSQMQQWVKSAFSLAFSAGILGFLGAVIFIAREKSGDTSSIVDVSWSGILVILSALMQVGVGVLLFLPYKRGQVEFEQA